MFEIGNPASYYFGNDTGFFIMLCWSIKQLSISFILIFYFSEFYLQWKLIFDLMQESYLEFLE